MATGAAVAEFGVCVAAVERDVQAFGDADDGAKGHALHLALITVSLEYSGSSAGS